MSSSPLACPKCSSVVREGVHAKPFDVRPCWMFASNTTRKHGRDHWVWAGCEHARKIGPDMPVDSREVTEAKWEIEARRLLAEKTVAWRPEVRAEFERVLGFSKDGEPTQTEIG